MLYMSYSCFPNYNEEKRCKRRLVLMVFWFYYTWKYYDEKEQVLEESKISDVIFIVLVFSLLA